jgi:acetylglutamate kinase
MYGQQLETGRRAGGFPPIDAIVQWIEDKGIQAIDISVSSLAFLIARKIAREGWNRDRFGGVELISTVITDKRIQNIIDKYGEAKTTEAVSDIIRLTKETLN